MSSFQTVLVPTDFSDHSDAAVTIAVEIASAFGSSLHVIHAVRMPVPLVTPYEVAIPENYLEQTREAAQRKLEALAASIRERGIDVTAHLGETPAAPAIARVADEIGADLVVMGTRGNTGLKHVLLGSVAERTLRSVSCPVLSVKAPVE